MKKQIVMLALTAMLAASLAGCAGKKAESDSVEQKSTVEATPNGYVTLGEYKGLSVEKKVYTITEEDIQNEIDAVLDENAEYKDIKDRGAKKGDIITVSYKGTENGKEVEGATEEEYDFEIGMEEFGKEFDDGLIGMKIGDTKTITVEFPENYEYDETWAGKKIDFEVKASAINEKILPEYTDQFVSENYDCKTTAEYEASIKQSLEADYEFDSNSEAGSDALDAAIANATINGYPEELYNSCYEEVKSGYESYAEMFEVDKSEIYNMFEITEDDIKSEAMDLVNLRLVVDAIATAENISVSDEDYNLMVTSYVEDWGCESQAELEETYGVDYIKQEMLQQKVMDFLLANANVSEVEASMYEEE